MKGYEEHIFRLKEKDQYRSLSTVDKRKVESEDLINLSSNDYLNLSGRTDLQAEFFSNLPTDTFVMSAVSSRLLTGNHFAYNQLEEELAAFFHKETSLVFGSGYHLNTSVLPVLAEKGDLILSDKLVHASIIDGIKLSAADSKRFRHLDYNHARKILQNCRSSYRRVYLVTESVFSMDGDTACSEELLRLKKDFNLFLYIDEAHSVGVYGSCGRGWSWEERIIEEVDILVGTFGKAFASYGAFMVSSSIIRNILINKARSLIFSTALSPVQVLWTHFILQKMKSFDKQRQNLMWMSDKLRKTISDTEYTTLGSSHIVPLICKDNALSVQLSLYLQRAGFYILPIRPPTVPKGSSRLRFSLNSGICRSRFSDLINLIKEVGANYESILAEKG
ncbi:MAG: aminotransferase class I/II-fold pyridoxal phosphate-dependent enzyme [Bacteroidales bacterium]